MRLIAILPILLLLLSPALAADQASDDQIYDRVRVKIYQDRDIGSANLQVTVEDAIVTLRGQVTKDKFKKKAEKIAKKVKGVKQVVNELTVAPQ